MANFPSLQQYGAYANALGQLGAAQHYAQQGIGQLGYLEGLFRDSVQYAKTLQTQPQPQPPKETEAKKCFCCLRSAVVCKAEKAGYLPREGHPASWLHRLRMEILEWHDDVLGRLETA